jgi:hypothetical protein
MKGKAWRNYTNLMIKRAEGIGVYRFSKKRIPFKKFILKFYPTQCLKNQEVVFYLSNILNLSRNIRSGNNKKKS